MLNKYDFDYPDDVTGTSPNFRTQVGSVWSNADRNVRSPRQKSQSVECGIRSSDHK